MNATQEIFQLISRDIAINKCLSNNLLNSRALAKFLIKKYSLSYSEEAVVSAIRRYNPEVDKDEVVEDVLEGAMLFLKNNIVCLTTDIADQNKFAKILQDEELNKNIRLVRTKKYSKIVVYEKEIDVLTSHFLDSQIVKSQAKLVEIRLLLRKDAHDTIGLLSNITSQVALHNIPIQEMIIALPEFLIYVKEIDSLRTQKVLMNLIGKKN